MKYVRLFFVVFNFHTLNLCAFWDELPYLPKHERNVLYKEMRTLLDVYRNSAECALNGDGHSGPVINQISLYTPSVEQVNVADIFQKFQNLLIDYLTNMPFTSDTYLSYIYHTEVSIRLFDFLCASSEMPNIGDVMYKEEYNALYQYGCTLLDEIEKYGYEKYNMTGTDMLRVRVYNALHITTYKRKCSLL